MLRVTLRSCWEHKRRLISTVFAIVLGVAFMAGTFVLTDTLDQVFDDLFAEGNAEVDAQVQGGVLFEDQLGGGDQRALLDPELVDTVAGVDGVAVAEPHVVTLGFGSNNRLLDAEGEPVGASQGPPTLLESWIPGSPLTPYTVAEGRGPEADDEVALNVAAADDAGFDVGDTVTLVTQLGRTEYTMVGTLLFGTAESSAGAVSVELTLAEVQRIAGTDGRIQTVVAGAEPGVTQRELAGAIAEAVPDDIEVLTGEEAAAQISADIQEGFGFLQQALTIFGAIALLVGIFVISNTFSILVAQRTRELALLRAVGAGRGQLLRSVMLEAVLVGLIAAALGMLVGIGLAKAVLAVLEASGGDLPTSAVVIRLSTVLVALVVGLGVTLIAALVPAVRATRVPPLAALRDVAVDRSAASRVRIGLGVVVLIFGAFNLSAAWTQDGDTDAIPTVGIGALLLVVGAIVIGPVLASASIRAIGIPLPRLKGVTGKLATENAARSPKRTSATASALVVGVALVAFVTVFAASAKKSVTAEVDRGFSADFVVQGEAVGFGPPSGFPASVADAIDDVEGVETVVPLGFGSAELTYPDGTEVTQFLTSVEPEGLSEVLEPRMAQGSIGDLDDEGIVVDIEAAKDHDLAIGDTVEVTAPGGDSIDLEVQALSDDLTLLGVVTTTREAYRAIVPQLVDFQVFATVADGADGAGGAGGADLDAVMADVEQAIADTPSLQVLDRDGFIGDLSSQITSFVTVIYGLLLLSIIIALIGIGNTLSLSINERTRELGLLRAVGMDRRQLRSAVRWEAVLISVLGALVGISLGLVLSYALVTSLEGFGLSSFAMPMGSLAVIVVLAALLGTLASVRPSRRAARLQILDAITHE
jgi:putative ABC transport system permease protein